MLKQLKELTPSFTFFIHEFPNLMVMKRGMKGGTAHTCVRERIFYHKTYEGISMAQWLHDATEGELKDIGMHLMNDPPA